MNRQYVPELSPGRRVEGGSMSGPPTASVLAYLERWRGGPPTTIDDLRGIVSPPYLRREIESAIEALRVKGHPIIGGAHGVYLTENPHELALYIEARSRRMASMYLVTRALRRTYRKMRERADLTLWDVA